MKYTLHALSIALLLMVAPAASASVLVINNASPSPGQFSSAQSAVNVASIGDTLLFAGTDVTYGALQINKQLTLIGPGVDISGPGPIRVAQLGVVSLTATTANGCKFSGLRIFQIISTDTGSSVFSNITVTRCWIDDCLYLSNDDWTGCFVEGNIFTSAGPNVTGNNNTANLVSSTLRNNIFSGILNYINANDVRQNVFTGTANGNVLIINQGAGNTFHNNIVSGRNCTSVDITSNITGNVSYLCLSPNFFGTGNFASTNPEYVSYNMGPFEWSDDFNLQPTSPVLGAGADGFDPGIFGGEGIFRKDLEPDFPIVRSFQITGPNAVPAGSTITINVNSVIHE